VITTRDVEAERAEIHRIIGGKTLVDVFAETVASRGNENALNWRTGDGWHALTWNQYRDQVGAIAIGLRGLGLKRGEFVVIMASNRPEHLIADLGVIHAGATPVTLYNTLAPEQVAYVTGHCEATIAVVEDAQFLGKFNEVRDQLPDLRTIVVLDAAAVPGDDPSCVAWDDVLAGGGRANDEDPEAFQRLGAEVKPTDLATLIYTSGTTGSPKGVMDSHEQVLFMAVSATHWLPRSPEDRHISYLPLAHAFERFVGHWYAIYVGSRTYFCADSTKLFAYAAEVKPTTVIGVPRVWEKLHSALNAGVAAEPDKDRRTAVMAALKVGRQMLQHRQAGTAPPAELVTSAERSRPVWNSLLAKVGLEECTAAVTGAAPISIDVIEFFQALELPLVEGWGMTETTVGATFAPRLDSPRNGTVGVPDFGDEVRLADDGELLVRGGNVARGYYKSPDQTRETFDADGWLHTGDVGTIDDDGFVTIVDRKKELIITAGGKNISPAQLENLLKQNPLIAQVCAIGDRRPFITALIVLDGEVAPEWAKRRGIESASVEDLATHPEVIAAVQEAVDECNRHVARVEAIRRFTILPAEWGTGSDELTPTMKLKRRVVHERNADLIEAMYSTD
jgi:long-chain acyl-CoA synthetase